MRKRLAIVGISDEALALIPILEANPDVEIASILCDDPALARASLRRTDAGLAERFGDRLTSDGRSLLRTGGLAALIDAAASPAQRAILDEASDHGIQVTTPLVAKLLFGFGPLDGARKPDLLHALSEVLESYNLTVDRKGLLARILQIAVGATGADRGSLMLYDEAARALRVEVAIGIERELLAKIRVHPGEGIAGRAFESRQAILLHGKADRARYEIVRERDDVESAISAPLLHADRALGVLNLSHARARGAFDSDDLSFVQQLAAIDAKILTRADEYQRLRRDSAQLRAQAQVREILARPEPLAARLSDVCRFGATELEHGLAHVWLYDGELEILQLRASSVRLDPLAGPLRLRSGEGLVGLLARTREPLKLHRRAGGTCSCFALFPMLTETGERLLGAFSVEGTLSADDPDLRFERIETIATTLSHELADALRQARMERESLQLAAIGEASATLALREDAAELHRAITSSAAMILEAEHAVLRLVDAASGRFQIRSYFGSADTEQQGPLFAVEKELSMGAIQGRAGVRQTDLARDPKLAALGADVSSALVEPLLRDGRVLGSLAVLGKVALDPLAADVFDRDDQVALARFAAQAERALERATERERARHQRRFDELTGLPNAAQFSERLEEEIARAGAGTHRLALVRLRLAGISELLRHQREAEADRLVLSVAQELRAALREFDIIGRTAPDTFEMIVPEPRDDISTLIGPLARRATEAIRREPQPELFSSVRLELGYGLYPEEAESPKGLRDQAQTARITTQ